MDYVTIAIGALGIAAAAGGLAAWYKRSEGKDSLELAQSTIAMYKDREATYLQQIAELTTAGVAKDASIRRQQDAIKTMVKEFKDYKNAS